MLIERLSANQEVAFPTKTEQSTKRNTIESIVQLLAGHGLCLIGQDLLGALLTIFGTR